MKIRLVSHASVIIEADGTTIWTDPWLFGKAFNDSWSLLPEPGWDPAWLDRIDYLWVSHEHPDHFHVPTLRSLPEDFKKRVIVLFQENNSDKMFRALEALGFPRHQKLRHRKVVKLRGGTSVYCYLEGQMNSALAVESHGVRVLNINDAELRTADCRLIVGDVGPCQVVLNQFSIAGYSGLPNRKTRLSRMGETIMRNMVANHRDLGASWTLPFASFVYFSCEDNAYVNDCANTPRQVAEYLRDHGAEPIILYPGEEFTLLPPHDSASSLARFEATYKDVAKLPFERSETVSEADLAAAFASLTAHLHTYFPKYILAVLRHVLVHVPDLDQTFRFSLAKSSWEKADVRAQDADLVVYSQPLHFALKHAYGVQTLGVSARYKLLRSSRTWQLHRILFALNNAEIYLKPEHLFTRRNLEFAMQRLHGGGAQVARRLATMLE